jgi:protocatechuate 3,4-dioxygenase beta subunit
MYFEGDPLIKICPIVNVVPDKEAIDRLIAPLDINAAVPDDCLTYRFDIVLRGRRSTLFENRLEGN